MIDSQNNIVANTNFDGKEEHIKAAIQFFASRGVRIDRANAMLVDDSTPNTDVAKTKGPVVVVPIDNQSAAYIQQIRQHTSVNLSRVQQVRPLPVKPVPKAPPAPIQTAAQHYPPIVTNGPSQPIIKPQGPPPSPPQGVQAEQYQRLPPAPPPLVGLHNPPRQGPTIPVPLTPSQVAQHLPQNKDLEKILSPKLSMLMQTYQSSKENAHQNDKGLTNLYNKTKQALNAVKGMADKRMEQLASIVNVFTNLKKDQTKDPGEKAAIAYAHLENLKKDNNSTGLRQVCFELQQQIKGVFPNVVEKGVRAQYKEEAKALANTQAPHPKNDKKLK